CAGVARLARRAAARPLALPRCRRARAARLESRVGLRPGLPAVVRRSGGDLRRRPAARRAARAAAAPVRAAAQAADRARSLVRLRGRDEPGPGARLRPRTALERALERARGASRRSIARARPARGVRRARVALRGSRALVARGLGGGVDRLLRAARGALPGG